ncbi:MAG: hypothetical protein ACO3IA_06380 [Candidatus Nanopelagicales bacterium]
MKTILAFVIAATAVSTNAEEIFESKRTMLCSDSAIDIMQRITGPKINEQPVWVGIEAETGNGVTVLVNNQTGTYTILFVKNNFACVISHGATEKKKTI